MGTMTSITMQSLGKIVQRAPAVGAKMWCLFFWFVCHAPSPERLAFEGCIVGTALRCRLYADFDAVCNVFFGRDCAFRHAT